MKIYLIGFLVFLYSCGKHETSKVVFEGNEFELPIKVKAAKEKLKLKYGYYVGFWGGDLNDKSIVTQLEGYPFFMGSDNDNEECYYEQDFVGITFFQANKTLEQFRKEIEKQYKQRFIPTINLDATRKNHQFDTTFYYIKTSDGMFITLKEIERSQSHKKAVSISFYKGVSEKELGKYLKYVHLTKDNQ